MKKYITVMLFSLVFAMGTSRSHANELQILAEGALDRWSTETIEPGRMASFATFSDYFAYTAKDGLGYEENVQPNYGMFTQDYTFLQEQANSDENREIIIDFFSRDETAEQFEKLRSYIGTIESPLVIYSNKDFVETWVASLLIANPDLARKYNDRIIVQRCAWLIWCW